MVRSIVAAVLLSPASVSGAESFEDASTSFEGKIVVFIVDESTTLEAKTDRVTISSPSVVDLGSRPFVFGQRFEKDSQNSSADGKDRLPHVGIACDRIVGFFVFTPESLNEWLKRNEDDRED